MIIHEYARSIRSPKCNNQAAMRVMDVDGSNIFLAGLPCGMEINCGIERFATIKEDGYSRGINQTCPARGGSYLRSRQWRELVFLHTA